MANTVTLHLRRKTTARKTGPVVNALDMPHGKRTLTAPIGKPFEVSETDAALWRALQLPEDLEWVTTAPGQAPAKSEPEPTPDAPANPAPAGPPSPSNAGKPGQATPSTP